MPSINLSQKNYDTLKEIKDKEDIKTFDGVINTLFQRLHYMTKLLQEKSRKEKGEGERESFL